MAKQLTFNMYRGTRGGRRPSSGRKRIHSPGVAHRRREAVSSRTPLHVNFKYRASIRNKTCLKLLKKAILNGRQQGLRILHFSLQHNHIHLIIEATTNEILTRGMRSITVTFAKGLRRGSVQLERYHLHVLRSVQATKNAVTYVLFNRQKHEKGTCSTIDEYTSLLGLVDWRKRVREFARTRKVSLRVRACNTFPLDPGRSFLSKLA